jgi:hypothetical protein
MFKKLFKSKFAESVDGFAVNRTKNRGTFQAAYAEWCSRNDIATIVGALDRLSDRRLNMLGLRRDNLFDVVEDMVDSAKEQRAIGQEVIGMLEASSITTYDHAPARKISDSVEASAVGWHIHRSRSIPRFDNAILSQEWTQALWDEFMTVAPRHTLRQGP